jgi:pimeloyl-ACP methyl ester carboxylesterase
MKSRAIALIACFIFTLAGAAAAAPAAKQTGRMALDGVDYYYEVHGKGEPVLILHGGLGSIDMFGPAAHVIPRVTTAGRQVIAVDLQGHGRTTLGNRPIRLESIGNDMAALVKKLGHKQVDVAGYSFGGGVGLRMAIQHPDVVRRLVVISAPYASDGFYADMRVQQKQVGAAMGPMMKETPIYKTYAAVAPKREDFPKLLDAMGDLMRQEYDWSTDVTKLKMPVMLVFGDADMTRPEHEIKFYQLLGGGLKDAGWNRETMSHNRLAILPDLTHYEMFNSPRVAEAILPFLQGRTGPKGQGQQASTRPRTTTR